MREIQEPPVPVMWGSACDTREPVASQAPGLAGIAICAKHTTSDVLQLQPEVYRAGRPEGDGSELPDGSMSGPATPAMHLPGPVASDPRRRRPDAPRAISPTLQAITARRCENRLPARPCWKTACCLPQCRKSRAEMALSTPPHGSRRQVSIFFPSASFPVRFRALKGAAKIACC